MKKKYINILLGDMEVNRDLKLLLTIGGLYALAIFLSNTFVNIYLWKQSNDYVSIAVYNMFVYILQPITFIIGGKMAKKVDRVLVLRLGVSALAIFFLTVLFVGEKAATYNMLLGSLLGIGYGLYWLAFNVLTFEITEPETRDFFNGFLGLMQSFGGMVGPVLAGYIIAQWDNSQGYTVIFTISFLLFIGAVTCSFFIKRRSAEGKFYFVRILKERKNNKDWSRILYAHILQGLREGIFVFVISIWVFIATGSELALGTFNLVFSGCSFLCYYLATRFVKPHMRKRSILFGGITLFLAIFIIIFKLNYTILLLYGAIIGIAYPLFTVPYVSLTYDVIGKSWKAKEMRIEYIVVREMFLNIGRVSSIIIFLISIQFAAPETIIPIVLLVLGCGHFLVYFLIKDIALPFSSENEMSNVKEDIMSHENR
ncbi:Major Facilitator Superfamily protein [Paraliobacillus sp. PM-2]|uniref:MFS transporter n=1 Tax=Paraliobacillus sp. PM-2 TaxID=1462524 RepID=UPI00061BD476|nr:MFS transporter [Paraliobacillus sp. PM-2]CQR46857.1 Major Facilitator Superfamily protein [Paraliobacillus sp. PM-2]